MCWLQRWERSHCNAADAEVVGACSGTAHSESGKTEYIYIYIYMYIFSLFVFVLYLNSVVKWNWLMSM